LHALIIPPPPSHLPKCMHSRESSAGEPSAELVASVAGMSLNHGLQRSSHTDSGSDDEHPRREPSHIVDSVNEQNRMVSTARATGCRMHAWGCNTHTHARSYSDTHATGVRTGPGPRSHARVHAQHPLAAPNSFTADPLPSARLLPTSSSSPRCYARRQRTRSRSCSARLETCTT
jgi:hypothetical protein